MQKLFVPEKCLVNEETVPNNFSLDFQNQNNSFGPSGVRNILRIRTPDASGAITFTTSIPYQ